MPPSARPWGRDEDVANPPMENTSPGGKAMGACKPSSKFDAPFALDPRGRAVAPPPGVMGDAWVSGPGPANPLPSVNAGAPFGTDYTDPTLPEESHKPWLQQKPAPWNNPDNNVDNFKFGRRIVDERPGEDEAE